MDLSNQEAFIFKHDDPAQIAQATSHLRTELDKAAEKFTNIEAGKVDAYIAIIASEGTTQVAMMGEGSLLIDALKSALKVCIDNLALNEFKFDPSEKPN